MSYRVPKLSRHEIRALEMAANDRPSYGRAPAHGGYAASRTRLLKHGYINLFSEKITDAGRRALAEAKGGRA